MDRPPPPAAISKVRLGTVIVANEIVKLRETLSLTFKVVSQTDKHFHLTHIVVDFFVVTVSHFSESVRMYC